MAEEESRKAQQPEHLGDAEEYEQPEAAEDEYEELEEGEENEESDEESDEDEQEDRSGTEEEISAPSVGPHTVIEREPVEVRLARHEQSEVDAMGKDKRRAVVGQAYGPSRTRQLTLYGIFLAVVAVFLIGGKLLADKLDQPPDHITPKAPWAQPDAKQIPPKPLQ